MLKKVREFLSEAVFPTNFPCAACGSEHPLNHAYLCEKCAASMKEVVAHCPVCGRATAEDAVCGDCRGGRGFDRAAAPYIYEGPARNYVLAFKYGNALHIAPAMAQKMVTLVPPASVVVPVPGSKKSMRVRGYNQAALLAEELANLINIPLSDCLIKSGSGKIQHELSREERFKNASESFALKPDTDLAFNDVLLVDDILTTGATAEACAWVLKSAGARSVFVVTFATASDFHGKKIK